MPTVTTTEDGEEVQSSRKREITATVVAATVTIALGIGANILIEKVANRVKDKIHSVPEESE
jgi:hypothetical protein